MYNVLNVLTESVMLLCNSIFPINFVFSFWRFIKKISLKTETFPPRNVLHGILPNTFYLKQELRQNDTALPGGN